MHVTADAMKAYLRVCIANPGSDEGRRGALVALGFANVPPEAATPFLSGRPGVAWVRPVPAGQMPAYAVVTRPGEAWCSVLARGVEPSVSPEIFSHMVESLRSPQYDVRKVGDVEVTPGGGIGRDIRYVGTRRPPAGTGIVYVLSMDADGGRMLLSAGAFRE